MSRGISIIIPVYNGGPAFRKCLEAVKVVLRPEDELIVVADGESDGAWRIAPEYGAKVINLEKNGGPARARNIGAKIATKDLIYFVDADVAVPADALTIIERVFDADPGLSALIGSYDEFPGETNFLSQFKNLLHHYVHQRGSTQAFTFWGACGAIKRDVFFSVGAFNEFYAQPSIEDIELGYRMTAAKHRIALTKELQVSHLKRWEPKGLIKTEFFQRAVPWTRLIWRHYWWTGKMETDLNLDAAHRFSVLTSWSIIGTLLISVVFHWALLVTAALVTLFLLLNAPLLRFFNEKRGFWFAVQAAAWRFIYDIYSLLGFAYGSSHAARRALIKMTYFTVAKLDPLALGTAVGVTAGLSLFAATGILLLKGGDNIGANLSLLVHYMPGYSVSWQGAAIALAEGFLGGFIFGWSFSTVRNFSVRLVLGVEKVRVAIFRILKRRLA